MAAHAGQRSRPKACPKAYPGTSPTGCTHRSIGSRLQVEPHVSLGLEVDGGEADDALTDEALAPHALAAVQSQAHSHAVDVLGIDAVQQERLHELRLVTVPHLALTLLPLGWQQQDAHLWRRKSVALVRRHGGAKAHQGLRRGWHQHGPACGWSRHGPWQGCPWLAVGAQSYGA